MVGAASSSPPAGFCPATAAIPAGRHRREADAGVHAPGVALAALGTLAFGAVLGPEAPLIALGSVVGLAVTTSWPSSQADGVLAMAGSFSAVSALFGGPLVAGMLLVEARVGMGAVLIPVLLPGLVAAAVGYLLFVGLGDWGGLRTTLAVPGLPAYDGTSVARPLLAVASGSSRPFSAPCASRSTARWRSGRGSGWRCSSSPAAWRSDCSPARGGARGDSQETCSPASTRMPALVAEDSARSCSS